jgi:hypothetical protein
MLDRTRFLAVATRLDSLFHMGTGHKIGIFLRGDEQSEPKQTYEQAWYSVAIGDDSRPRRLAETTVWQS